MKKIKVIGLGGIGTNLAPHLCRYLNFEGEKIRIVFVDGDSFEEKNKKRQTFKRFGNKAEVVAQDMAQEFQYLSIRAIREYISNENISEIIQDGDIVFLCVDNHSTRRLVSDYCETLDDIILISGGNELTDGNVQVYIKESGKDITAALTRFHPEIRNAKGKSPAEMDCMELASQPESKQLLFANLQAATAMLVNFWRIEQGLIEDLGETYFDIKTGKMITVSRRV